MFEDRRLRAIVLASGAILLLVFGIVIYLRWPRLPKVALLVIDMRENGGQPSLGLGFANENYQTVVLDNLKMVLKYNEEVFAWTSDECSVGVPSRNSVLVKEALTIDHVPEAFKKHCKSGAKDGEVDLHITTGRASIRQLKGMKQVVRFCLNCAEEMTDSRWAWTSQQILNTPSFVSSLKPEVLRHFKPESGDEASRKKSSGSVYFAIEELEISSGDKEHSDAAHEEDLPASSEQPVEAEMSESNLASDQEDVEEQEASNHYEQEEMGPDVTTSLEDLEGEDPSIDEIQRDDTSSEASIEDASISDEERSVDEESAEVMAEGTPEVTEGLTPVERGIVVPEGLASPPIQIISEPLESSALLTIDYSTQLNGIDEADVD